MLFPTGVNGPFEQCPQCKYHYKTLDAAMCEECRRNWCDAPTLLLTIPGPVAPNTCQDCGKADECVTADLPWCFTCHARLARRYAALKEQVTAGRRHEFSVPHPDEDPYGWFATHLHEEGTFGCWCPPGTLLGEMALELRAKGVEL
jgi:hypothetical protein